MRTTYTSRSNQRGGVRRDLKSEGGLNRGNTNEDNGNLRYSMISHDFKDNRSITERHGLRMNFRSIKESDPLGLVKRYRKKVNLCDKTSQTRVRYQNDKFLHKFYQCCCMIPIMIVLGLLFYLLYFLSPRSNKLRIYQQDIIKWNEMQMSDLVPKLDFQYQITQGEKSNEKYQNIKFWDKPQAGEKDEIKLRDTFFYKQAYFAKREALLDEKITPVTWSEDNVLKILSSAENVTKKDEKDKVYESHTYCMNIKYMIKNDDKNSSQWVDMHSSDPADDIKELPTEVQKPFSNVVNKDNKTKTEKMDIKEIQMSNIKSKQENCLIPFKIWQEDEDDIIDDTDRTVNELDPSEEKEKKACEQTDFGIFVDKSCYYFEVLKKLCIKVRLQTDESKSNIKKIVYDAGCFEDDNPSLFKNAEVGQYYDFGHEITLEVRSRYDPYMVFSYAKYNLGADFTLFFYLGIACFVLASWAFFVCMYMFCCQTERIPKKQQKRDDDDDGTPMVVESAPVQRPRGGTTDIELKQKNKQSKEQLM